MLVRLSPLESSSNTWQVNHTEWPSDATAHPHASTVNLTLRALVTAHAFPGAARSCHFMQQRERERCHCKPPHLPLLLIRTVCADALKKKNVSLPATPLCQPSKPPPPPPAFLTLFISNLHFLSPLSSKTGGHRLSFYQLSFKSPTRKLIALWRRLLQGASRG